MRAHEKGGRVRYVFHGKRRKCNGYCQRRDHMSTICFFLEKLKKHGDVEDALSLLWDSLFDSWALCKPLFLSLCIPGVCVYRDHAWSTNATTEEGILLGLCRMSVFFDRKCSNACPLLDHAGSRQF